MWVPGNSFVGPQNKCKNAEYTFSYTTHLNYVTLGTKTIVVLLTIVGH
jgi:hypothetical protein